jgi:hypothetical protein
MPGRKTLAYYEHFGVREEKSFISFGPGGKSLKRKHFDLHKTLETEFLVICEQIMNELGMSCE